MQSRGPKEHHKSYILIPKPSLNHNTKHNSSPHLQEKQTNVRRQFNQHNKDKAEEDSKSRISMFSKLLATLGAELGREEFEIACYQYLDQPVVVRHDGKPFCGHHKIASCVN